MFAFFAAAGAHTHTFRPADDGTEIEDEVRYRLPLTPPFGDAPPSSSVISSPASSTTAAARAVDPGL